MQASASTEECREKEEEVRGFKREIARVENYGRGPAFLRVMTILPLRVGSNYEKNSNGRAGSWESARAAICFVWNGVFFNDLWLLEGKIATVFF